MYIVLFFLIMVYLIYNKVSCEKYYQLGELTEGDLQNMADDNNRQYEGSGHSHYRQKIIDAIRDSGLKYNKFTDYSKYRQKRDSSQIRHEGTDN